MASCIFYKFKNSKEPERITFDGTGISVFECKREIINLSGLGDGSDFDLHLYPEDSPKEEYIDDTTIISRSSTVIASRRPAPRGHGKAARYVSGRAPVRAIKKTDNTIAPLSNSGAPQTEQDAEAAFMAESAQVWDQQKQSMAHAKPVFHKKKPMNVPAHDPPPGYVCYRCQKKGHWIQACPTNDDPDFKPAPRTKRTTGIPRSFLKTVEKPADGDLEDTRGIMLNAEGEYVMVTPDTKTWEKFQEKTNATKAQAANVDAVNKEVRERGLDCPIDKRMFIDPVKTPCCGKTYCHECIENALADGDLVCPNCSTEGVLIDDLTTDEEMVENIRAFEAEKSKEKAEKEKKQQEADEKAIAAARANSPSNQPNNNNTNGSVASPAASGEAAAQASEKSQNRSGSQSPTSSAIALNTIADSQAKETGTPAQLTVAAAPILDTSTSTPGAGGNNSDSDGNSTTSKKRKEAPTDIKPPSAPKAMRMKEEQVARQVQDQASAMEKDFLDSMEALKNMPKMPASGAAPNMQMPMNPMMNMMGAQNMNPMMMNQMNGVNTFNGMGGNWNQGFNAQGYNNMQQGNWNQGFNNGYGMQANMGFNTMNNMNGGYGNWNQSYGNGNMGGFQNSGFQGSVQQQDQGNFANQQRNMFAEQPSDKDAYERKPVNPMRSQNRNRRNRPTDYHYV